MRILEQTITRRGFIKVSGTTAALATLGPKLFGAHAATLIEGKPTKPVTGQDEWIPTTCRACRLGDGVIVHVKDGVAIKIEGNPEEPKNLGKNCGKSAAGLMALYNPWAIKAPMKRTNPQKGMGVDPGWVEITWDEAINTVAGKIREAYDKDSRRIGFTTCFGSLPMYATLAQALLPNVKLGLGSVWKTPNIFAWGPGELCGGGLHTAPMRTMSTFVNFPDVERAKYLINFGSNFLMSGKGTPENARMMIRAKQNGCKFVVFDPLCGPDAAYADEWIPIRPATDQAVALAMGNVLIEAGLIDEWALKNRTNAPYLIGPDGFYLRSKTEMCGPDYMRENEVFGKPLVWDAGDNKAKTFDDKSIKDFALEGTYTVDGVRCKPAFQLIKETYKQFTPEWAEGLSTVPASTIRRIAKEFGQAAQIGSWTTTDDGVRVPYRPVDALYGKGSQGHGHAANICRSIEMLDMFVGAHGAYGGEIYALANAETSDPGVDGTVLPTILWSFAKYRFKYPSARIDLHDTRPFAHTAGSHAAHVILHPEKYGLDYNLDVLGLNFTNPLTNMHNYKLIEEAMQKIPFIWAISYHFDDPTEFCDVVLPEGSYLERYDWTEGLFHNVSTDIRKQHKAMIALRHPVVEKLYNTKDPLDILNNIIERMGLLPEWNNAMNMLLIYMMPPYLLSPNKNYTSEEIFDRMAKARFGRNKGLDFLKKHGFWGLPLRDSAYYAAAVTRPKWRGNIYDEYFKWTAMRLKSEIDKRPDIASTSMAAVEEFDNPIPVWQGTATLEKESPEYDLYAVNWNGAINVMGMVMDDHWKHLYMDYYDPYLFNIWINADTAATKGLMDGDWAYVESRAGSVKGKVKTSQLIHPECVGIGGRFGTRSLNAAPHTRAEGSMCFNDLIPSDEESLDPISGNVEGSPKVKIYKA